VDCFVSDVSNKSARSRSGAFLSTALEYKCDEVMDILLIELKGDESLEENNETPKVLEEISKKISEKKRIFDSEVRNKLDAIGYQEALLPRKEG
jgi:hypothetical protein